MKKLLLTITILFITGCSQPTSIDLSQSLIEQESKLEEIVTLLQGGLTTGEDGLHFTPEQYALFHQMLDQLDILYSKYLDACQIQLSKYRTENDNLGIDRGFAYRCDAPKRLVNDIDTLPTPNPGDYDVMYQHVKENWYLFVEYYLVETEE